MKILMIYPPFPATFWSFKYALRFVSKKSACPPLSLLTVAAMLPEEWDIRLRDLNAEKLKDKDILWADYVMITGMLIQKEAIMEILGRCRALGARVIAGGPLFTSMTEDYLDLVDHFVLNEAEITLPPFLRDLENNTPQKIYRSQEFPDLSLTPIPRWDLIDTKNYQTLVLQCSRGCPFNCEFCDITSLFGRRPRIKSAGQLISEMEAIFSLGWRGPIFFVDDNFIGNKVEIKKLLVEIISWMKERDYPFTITTEASINLADDDELIELMVEAGFDTVFVGLETPNEESLMECGKKQNCGRDLLTAIKKLQGAGIQVLGGYIVGFDNDDEGIFARQIKFIQESGVVAAMVGLLNAAPKTRLWQRLKMENRLLVETTGDNTDGTINFIPKMDADSLIAGYRRLVKTIYHPRYFYQRVLNFLEEYQPRRRRKMKASEVKAFLKSILHIGILGNGASQWYYWKLLIKSAIFYRHSFSEVMTLTVYGYHFRKVSKGI